MQPMSYKPSRTREERKNAPLYVPESELRQQLEQQANLKRRQKTLESLKEKQEILDHYANFKLPGGESDTELANFLSQKQQELDVLNRQLEAQAPELYMEAKEPAQREIKRKEVQAPVFNDNFFSKQDAESRILSKGEIEREKRLKLRDEERMRRLAGVKESAYDGNAKSYLPQSLPSLPGASQPTEPKEELVLPIHRKQMNMAAYEPSAMYGEKRNEFQPVFDNRTSIEMHSNMLPGLDKKEADRSMMKEMLFAPNKEDMFAAKDPFAGRFEDKENMPMMNVMPMQQEVRQSISSVTAENKLPPILGEYNKGENVVRSKERESVASRGGNREKGEKAMGGNDIFSKLGGGAQQGNNLSEAEKKRKYKEELDAIVKMKNEGSVPAEGKRNERRPSYGNMEAPREVRSETNVGSREAREMPTSLPSIQGERGRSEREAYAYPIGVDKNLSEREEKKKKYAEELMQEIMAKEKERERAKQERRAPSSAAQKMPAGNEGAWSELNVQNRVSESQDRQERGVARRDELPPRGSAAGGGMRNVGKEEDSEMEKKRKYKEFLDAQVEERKRREKADVDRQEVYHQQGNQQVGRGERIDRMDSREERPSREIERVIESRAEAAPGGFFIHKGEDEEKQRAQLRNQQKQKMAEELKKQMEEKEEMKRREKQKKAEEDLREKERLERDAEQEKRRKQEEDQKKQQAEKKNQEYNVHSNVPETQASHPGYNDVKPQHYASSAPEDIERPGPDMGGRQAHLERAPYGESREDLGENQPYMPRQNFYGGNEHMYPPQHHQQQQQHGYYPSMQENIPQQYGDGYGYAPHMQYQGYHRQPGMGFEGPPQHPQQYGGYGMGGNLLQEMANYNMLMQQLMEEKLKIDKIALEEQLVLEQYNNKIKEMRVEKLQYDKEIDKIKKMLHGELPVNASVMGGMNHHIDRSHQLDLKLNALNDSYLPALMTLRNAKASHVDYYNRLLAQSQNNFSGQLRGLQNPQHQGNLGIEDTMRSQAFEDSAILRQSLPCSSDLRPISRAYLENSYQKDLKAYHEAKGHQAQDDNYNIDNYSNRMLTDHVLQIQQPQQPPKEHANLLDFSTSQPNISEFKPPVAPVMNEEFGESMILPEIEGTRAKRKIEQTPQVIYDRTPARLSQEEVPVATHHEIFDLKPGNVSDVKMVEDVSQFKLHTPNESHIQERARGHQQADMFKKESQVAQSYAGYKEPEPEEMSLKKRLQAVSNEENNLQDTMQASQTMGKLKNEGEMEVKMQEGNQERSLILAEEEEEDYNRDEFDAFVESTDQVLEELGIGYAKKGGRKVSRSPVKDKAPGIVEKMSKDNQKTEKTAEIPQATPGSHEKKYGKPKTKDPFAKAMEAEMSKVVERKEEQPSEFSKWSGFVMESERKQYPQEKRDIIASVAPKEDFEPIKVDESVFPEKHFDKHNETNEAYIDEDIQGSVKKNKGKYDADQFEVEEKIEENDEADDGKHYNKNYNKENQTVNVQGKPRKTRELERLGSKKDVNANVNASDSYQMKLQSNISLEEDDSKYWSKPITKTRNSNMDLLLGRNSETLASKREAKKQENKAENEKRSKDILGRLQRLLDNWGDEMTEENNENEKNLENKVAESQMEESSELGKVSQSRDLFKPLGIARSYSNRYSQDGDH